MKIEDISKLASSNHILVIDDDERLRLLLFKFLEENGFLVVTAENALDAREKLKHLDFDLIVMDVMMPGEDGVSLTQSLKSEKLATPIILLTALGDIGDRIKGLEAGADDYLPKPFEPKELLLRINAILKRTIPRDSAGKSKDYYLGEFKFDTERGELVNKDGSRLPLTQVESTLLKALFSKNGEIISREELAISCGIDASERTIDVQVTRLRKKVEEDSKMPKYIQTIRGRGYVLRVD